MTEQLTRLVRTLVGPHDLPAAPPTAWLDIGAADPVEVDLLELGSGTFTFVGDLPQFSARRCVLTVKVAEAARIDFPVTVTVEGSTYRATVSARALVLRRRTTPNAKLQEALNDAA